MKTIKNLMTKASEKGYVKNGAWEIHQVQGEFIRLNHYGTTILKVDYTTSPVTVQENSTSQSDSRAINFMLKELKLFKYPNSLKGFTEWAINNPTFYANDIIDGTLKRTKHGKIYTETMKIKSFLNDEIMDYQSSYEYDNGTFRYIENE